MGLFGWKKKKKNEESVEKGGQEQFLKDAPAEETSYSIPESRKPVVVSKEDKKPAAKTAAPKAEEKKPAAKAATPKAEEKKPAAKAATPKAEEKKPAAKAAAPKAEEKKPAAKATPKAEEKKPAAKAAAPKAEEKKPATKAAAPKAEEKKPAAKAAAPKAEEKKPATKAAAPKAEEKKPVAKAAANTDEPITSATEAIEVEAADTVTEGKATRNGTFDIKRTKDGRFVFNLYAANKVIIATSQIYSSSQSAKTGVKSVMANALKSPIEDSTLKNPNPQPFPKWEIYIDKAGEFRFRLYATNGSCICHAKAGYATKSNCKRGIESIVRLAADAQIDKSYLK